MSDEAEKWLQENDTNYRQGEYPYLSERQMKYRNCKELSASHIIDEMDFRVVMNSNYGSRGHLSGIKKDRHKQGQTE